MDQYTNYLDALSKPAYSQQADPTSPFLSPDSHPPSLSASPVSSEGSDSFIDEAVRYGLFGFDHSPTATYDPYYQNSMNNPGACSTPTNGRSSPGVLVKHEEMFSYDDQMAFDGGITSSLSNYQPFADYPSQERSHLSFDYPVHPIAEGSLGIALADHLPFATVAPSATSGYPNDDTPAYNLGAEIAELPISSQASSPFYHAGNFVSSPTSLPMSQPQPTQVCDPQALDSPMTAEQDAMVAGPSVPAEGRRRNIVPSYRTSTADSDYSPSGESEVEDASYGQPSNRKKIRSSRVSQAAHPYSQPAATVRGNKRRGTRLATPVPIPGLTKNSRGRTVPKKRETVVRDPSRPFWCAVEDCDKLFSRGEHLRRHVVSIHTKDKPFECQCGNAFSRQDNMFQHMRAKGCLVWHEDGVEHRKISDAERVRHKEGADDRHIKQIMADAKIAQKKRDKACRQACSRS